MEGKFAPGQEMASARFIGTPEGEQHGRGVLGAE